MTKTNPEDLLEFPCHYQFKAMGKNNEEFKTSVIAAVDKHATVACDNVRCRPSGKGTYQAVTVFVTLYSYEQLTLIYAELKKIDELKMLL